MVNIEGKTRPSRITRRIERCAFQFWICRIRRVSDRSRRSALPRTSLLCSYDPVDRIILEKNHQVGGRPLDVQKAQMKDGSQRPAGNSMRPMRGRPGGGGPPHSYSHLPTPPPPPPMSRPNYNAGYDAYPPNNYNDPYPPMPSNPYNGYSSDFNGNGAPFGQG